jgi:hypothetical protein
MFAPLEASAARARKEGWRYLELETRHWPVWDEPEAVAGVLLKLV